MTIREYIENVAENNDVSALLLTPEFDSAIIGIQQKDDLVRAVYSEAKMIDLLMTSLNTDRDEAREFYYFNIESAYVGEGTPIFIDDTIMELL